MFVNTQSTPPLFTTEKYGDFSTPRIGGTQGVGAIESIS